MEYESKSTFKIIQLLSLIFLLAISNSFSQPKLENEFLKNRLITNFEEIEDKFYLNKFEPESFINQQRQNNFINKINGSSDLDSVVVTRADGGKITYTFNSDKSSHTNLEVYQSWNGSAFTNSMRRTYIFDLDDNLSSYLEERWDDTKWVNSYRKTYYLESSKNIISRIDEYWDGNKWVNHPRTTYSYDSNGNLLSYICEGWDSNKWVYQYRTTYSYDSNGSKNFELNQNWKDNNWINTRKTTINYDANEIIDICEDWDGNKWVYVSKKTTTINNKANETVYLSEYWDENKWMNSNRSTYTHNLNDKPATFLYEFWPDSNWVNSHRLTWTYDSNGKEISCSGENWNNISPVDPKWSNFYRSTHTYDSNGNLSLFLCEIRVGNEWKMANDLINLEFNNYSIIFGAKVEIFYKSITDVNETLFSISDYSLSQNYPNPFNPSTTIKYSIPAESFGSTSQHVKLVVYDILGNKVATLVNEQQSAGNYEVNFNANSLTSGIYFYKLQSGNFVETKKMMLIK